MRLPLNIFLLYGLIALASISILGFRPVCATQEIIVKEIVPYSLGFEKVEFYEAFAVIQKPYRLDNLPYYLKSLCAKYPNVDTYVLRLFDSDEFATRKKFDRYSRQGVAFPDYSKFVNDYIAVFEPSLRRLTYFPLQQERSYQVTLPTRWCAFNKDAK